MNLMIGYRPMDEILARLEGIVKLYMASIQDKCNSLMAGLIVGNTANAAIPGEQKEGRKWRI